MNYYKEGQILQNEENRLMYVCNVATESKASFSLYMHPDNTDMYDNLVDSFYNTHSEEEQHSYPTYFIIGNVSSLPGHRLVATPANEPDAPQDAPQEEDVSYNDAVSAFKEMVANNNQATSYPYSVEKHEKDILTSVYIEHLQITKDSDVAITKTMAFMEFLLRGTF